MKKIQFYLATSALAGIFFIIIPFMLTRISQGYDMPIYTNWLLSLVGWLMVVGGVTIFVTTTQTFFNTSGSTPLITQPTKKVMRSGLYKKTRNPMYVGHLVLLFGIFLIVGSPLLLFYWITAAALLHLFIVFYEEPLTKKRLGNSYEKYLEETPRWF